MPHHHSHPHDGPCGEHRHHSPFGRRGFKPPFGPGMHGQAFAQFAGAMRARRGDIRNAVLRLLAEQPMHGYQIIQELSARSEGAWSPSAGSVYPTLQLLADEGLITAEETAGKKVYSLTEAGQAAVAELAEEPAPWEAATPHGTGPGGAYREAAGRLAQVVWQVGASGTPEQVEAATEILVETRKRLYSLLAED